MKTAPLLGIVALAALGGSAWWYTTDSAPDFETEEAWLEGRVESLQFTEEERIYEEIRWTHDIEEAFALAEEHRRPVVMYSNDGPLGRC